MRDVTGGGRIRAKTAAPDLAVNPRRGATHEPKRQRDRLAVNQGLAVSHDAGQPRLRRRGKLADILQEQGAAAGRRHAAPGVDRLELARRPISWPPSQREWCPAGRVVCTVDGHKRRVGRRAEPMEIPRNRSDVRARLGHEEHSALGRRCAPHQFLDPENGGRAASSSTAPPEFLVEPADRLVSVNVSDMS